MTVLVDMKKPQEFLYMVDLVDLGGHFRSPDPLLALPNFARALKNGSTKVHHLGTSSTR
jgi:hypothetical protein